MFNDLVYEDGAVAFWEQKVSRMPGISDATGGVTEAVYGAVYGMEQSSYITSGVITFSVPSGIIVDKYSSYTIEVVAMLTTTGSYNLLNPYLIVNNGVLEFHNESNVAYYDIEDDEFYHIIAIHDSQFDQLYINGALIEEVPVEYDTFTRPANLTMNGGAFQCVALYSLPLEIAVIEEHSDEVFDMPTENFDIYGAQEADFDSETFSEEVVYSDDEWLEGDYSDIAITEDGYLTPMILEDTSVPSSWTGIIPINSDDVIGTEDETQTNLLSGVTWTPINATTEEVINIDEDTVTMIVPTGASTDSYLETTLVLPEGFYTVAAVVSTEDQNVAATFHENARRLVVIVDDDVYRSEQINTFDDLEGVEFTFYTPGVVNTEIRLYNGSNVVTDYVYWDSWMLVAGEEILEYVDETTDDFEWDGTPGSSATSFALQPRDVYIEWEGSGAFDVEVTQDPVDGLWTPISKRTALSQVTGDDFDIRVSFDGNILNDRSEIRALSANVRLRQDLGFFSNREVEITGSPFISRVVRSPKQRPQEGLYLTNTDYITIKQNTTVIEDQDPYDNTVKMIELWLESTATGDVLTVGGLTVSATAGAFSAVGGTIVSNLNVTGKYTILMVVLDTAVDTDIVLKNAHITRIVLFEQGSTDIANEVLNSYLKPTTNRISNALSVVGITPLTNDSTWSITAGG